jgi:hypothetical protein
MECKKKGTTFYQGILSVKLFEPSWERVWNFNYLDTNWLRDYEKMKDEKRDMTRLLQLITENNVRIDGEKLSSALQLCE